MQTKHLRAALVATALSSALAASAAQASCGGLFSGRPGTPNELKVEPISRSTLRFSWRNTTGRGMNKSGSTSQGDTPHTMYFDITVRDGKGNDVGKSLTGTGPFSVTYGSRSYLDFNSVGSGQRLCFWIRARTGRGTQGCISKVASGPVCATMAVFVPNFPQKPRKFGTPETPAGTPEKPIKTNRGGTTSGPHITVLREAGNVFHVIGTSLRPNVPIAIRVVDARTLLGPIVTAIGGRPIISRGGGIVDARLYGFCDRAQGPLFFSLNDGRENKADKTGTLWSNTVQMTCQR